MYPGKHEAHKPVTSRDLRGAQRADIVDVPGVLILVTETAKSFPAKEVEQT